MDIFSLSFILSVLRVSTPLIFAAQAGLLSEKSGVVQIGLEGFMLAGAFSGAVFAHLTHSSYLGFLMAFVCGACASFLFSLLVVRLKTDAIVAGTGFNFLMVGLIPFLTKFIFNSTGSTPPIPIELRLSYEVTVFAFAVVLGIYFLISKTRWGYWIQFAGEYPDGLTACGVSVDKVRWVSVFLCGGLAALGGASLSLFLSSAYSPLMTGGRGFIALSALILGKWKPLPTLMGCLVFGVFDALQIRLQGVPINGFTIPVQWIQILPYVLTIVLLAGFFGRSQAPAYLGKR
ncbi:MAG: sugar ABC transporter permease [Bdellovibrio sp. 28-41-41]|nr:MAG: sugar ABC transporter permease [Bdellovibrio sp. 28-41-41]